MARRLGKPLMPHQQAIVDVALELDSATGYPAYSRVIVIGGRQVTGKTEQILSVATHRCVGFDDALARWVRDQLGVSVVAPGPQQVVYLAQNADKARERWRDVHVKRLQASSFYRPSPQFVARLQRNMEAIIWDNGSMWSPEGGSVETASTGDTLDLAFLDEAWAHEDGQVELGVRPAMMTRPWSQLWIVSMIPGPSRLKARKWAYLADQRRVARERVAAGVRSGTCLVDFTAPEGADPGDPETWWGCMPGLGFTVSEARVAQDYEDLPLADFEAEYLGWEPKVSTARWALISRDTWLNLLDPSSQISGVCALAVEVSEERDRAVVVAAGRRSDGDWHIEVVEPGLRVPEGTPGTEWLDRTVGELVDAMDPCTVVIRPGSPAASLVVPLRNRGVHVLTPSGVEVAAACGRFFDATGEKAGEGDRGVRVHHIGQVELDRALGSAKPYPRGVEGGFTFARRGAGGDVISLNGAVLAMHGYEVMAPGVDMVGDVW